MTKKAWVKPDVKAIEAGSAEAKNANRADATNTNKS